MTNSRLGAGNSLGPAPSPSLLASEITVAAVGADDPRLQEVVQLWRAHSDTLGFFPQGAFDEYARKGCILAALADNAFAGYLLYREARGWAVIVHLCLSRPYRGRGIPQRLLDELRRRTAALRGVSLSCRADFPANQLWPRLGFHQAYERAAQADGRVLCGWRLDYGQPDLFTHANEDLPVAVLDMNVVLDLATAGRPHQDEALPLLAPWVREAFQLAVTPEIKTEIGRGESADERRRLREWIDHLHLLRPNPDVARAELERVVMLLGRARDERGESDRRHLAHAVAGGAEVFITRDRALLDRATEIHDQLGLRLARPGTLIGDLDLTQRPDRYEPARLAGTGLSIRQARADEITRVAERFASTADGESPNQLSSTLAAAAASPEGICARVVQAPDGGLLSLDVTERRGREVVVRVLRLRGARLSTTLARHLLWETVGRAWRGGAEIVRLDDPYSARAAADALPDLGFIQTARGWVKILVRGVRTREQVAHVVGEAVRLYDLGAAWLQPITDELRSMVLEPERVLHLERVLWPVKLRDVNVPCFVVPIRPAWAAQLFDERMAAETLFAESDDLLLRVENAYYKSSSPAVIHSQGRVLWYISGKGKASGYSHAGTIASAAQITARLVGPAREVFRAYRRFGVYRWGQILDLADSDPEGAVLAFEFSRQEALPHPVSFEEAQRILMTVQGSRNNFVGAVQLEPAAWCALYEAGRGDAG